MISNLVCGVANSETEQLISQLESKCTLNSAAALTVQVYWQYKSGFTFFRDWLQNMIKSPRLVSRVRIFSRLQKLKPIRVTTLDDARIFNKHWNTVDPDEDFWVYQDTQGWVGSDGKLRASVVIAKTALMCWYRATAREDRLRGEIKWSCVFLFSRITNSVQIKPCARLSIKHYLGHRNVWDKLEIEQRDALDRAFTAVIHRRADKCAKPVTHTRVVLTPFIQLKMWCLILRLCGEGTQYLSRRLNFNRGILEKFMLFWIYNFLKTRAQFLDQGIDGGTRRIPV